MKIELVCTARYEKLAAPGKKLYSYEFHAALPKPDKKPGPAADFILETPEKMHYKVGEHYDITVAVASDIEIVPENKMPTKLPVKGEGA